MKKEDFVQEFIEKMKHTDFSSESKNKAKNLEALQAKLPIINQERENYMREQKTRIRKPIAIAACFAIILSMSAVVFGQDIVNYIRTTMLGDFAVFITGPGPEYWEIEEVQVVDIEIVDETSGEIEAIVNAQVPIVDDELQAMIDAGVIVIVTSDNREEPDWLTFTDAAEGKSHFITDVMLPTYAPDGFEFKHIFYFVETLEELEQYGANVAMGVVFSDGTNKIRMQIRYMTEDTGFATDATEDMRTMEINGHEAVVDRSVVNLLVGDVMYMFFGMNNVDDEALIRMAESLN
jgi:hypothetical protein